VSSLEPFTKAAAERLTEQIREATSEVWRLVSEARDRRAWEPLGYPSWSAYVLAEFGMSTRNAAYLLDQAHVVRAIETAASVELPAGTVSQKAAAAIKPRLPEIVEKVRDATRGQRGKNRQRAAVETVTAAKPQVSPRSVLPGGQLSFSFALPPKPTSKEEADRARALAQRLLSWANRYGAERKSLVRDVEPRFK
jgi:hypothetical protein